MQFVYFCNLNFLTHDINSDSYYSTGLMVQTWSHGIDKDSWYRHGLMIWSWTLGTDTDSRYRHGLMVQTWTYGTNLDSLYRHGLMVLTTPIVFTLTDGIVSILLDHTLMRGPSVAHMRDFFFRVTFLSHSYLEIVLQMSYLSGRSQHLVGERRYNLRKCANQLSQVGEMSSINQTKYTGTWGRW